MHEFLTDFYAILRPIFLHSANAVAIVVCGFFISRFLRKKVLKFLRDRDEILANFTAQLVFILGLLITIVTMLGTIGVQIASILAVLGTAGIAIALALKDSLSSIAGGIILIVLRPFQKGDVIGISGVEGKVESVNLFNTQIRLHDNGLAIIPNSNVSSQKIINFTDADVRRIELQVSVAYDTNLARAQEILQDLVEQMPKIDKNFTPIIGLTDFSDSAIIFTVRVWAQISDGLFAVKSELICAIQKAFADAGIEIPYNKMDVQIKS